MRTLKRVFVLTVIVIVVLLVYAVFFATPYNPNNDPDAYPQPCYEKKYFVDERGNAHIIILQGECDAT